MAWFVLPPGLMLLTSVPIWVQLSESGIAAWPQEENCSAANSVAVLAGSGATTLVS